MEQVERLKCRYADPEDSISHSAPVPLPSLKSSLANMVTTYHLGFVSGMLTVSHQLEVDVLPLASGSGYTSIMIGRRAPVTPRFLVSPY